MIKNHTYFMKIALEQARIAKENGDVPVGAVLVKNKEIIAKAYNTKELNQTALGHAEMSVIDIACKKLNTWRLTDCTLYVTLEPCPMCMGAILSSRIDTVIFGSYDYKYGCCGSKINLNEIGYNHQVEVLGGICELECNELIDNFFNRLRV